MIQTQRLTTRTTSDYQNIVIGAFGSHYQWTAGVNWHTAAHDRQLFSINSIIPHNWAPIWTTT